MPNRRAHELVNERLVGVPGTEVHRVMDSTAHTHGPSHRQDFVHSTEGAMLELARRGELTSHSVMTILTHKALDHVASRAKREMRSRLPRGPLREVVSPLVDKAIEQAFSPSRRR